MTASEDVGIGTRLAMSRRHEAGVDSARSLLFTVLGEFVLPTGSEAWTSSFIDVLGRLGVEEKASRQALMRTAADDWLDSERFGRRTLWRLTPPAVRLLRDGTERIFGFTATADAWDGQWTLVLARTPESARSTRHVLRTRLAGAGFGSASPGVWMSPGAGRQVEASRILRDAGVSDAQVFIAEHRGGGSLSTMIERAWDLPALSAKYEEFMAAFSRPASRDPLVRVINLVHAWRRFPWIDPCLPSEFLPDQWNGALAAQVFARLHAKWTDDAINAWQKLRPAALPAGPVEASALAAPD